MVEEYEDMEFISLHGCIRNTSIDATIFTEDQLKTLGTGKDYKDPCISG